MLNTVYQLKRPRQFETVFKTVDLDDRHVLVRPTHLSICNADQRYYQGKRNKEVIKKKLPMALIHEGIGKVIHDPTNTFQIGESVVMIPNLPEEYSEVIAENYLPTSKFCGSGEDGFMREFVTTKPDRLVRLPVDIEPCVAAFTELVSVTFHAISRFDNSAHKSRQRIGVWGDGNVAFITALLLKKMFSDSKVIVFGKHRQKLADFTFVDETYEITAIADDVVIDHAFECVGGDGSSSAISQIIDHIHPEGMISIMGVSEEPIPMNTRMILEKGLTVKGSSRSGRIDYEGVLSLYEQHHDIINHLEKIVGAKIHVRNLKDIIEAFETDIHKMYGKTIMIWEE